MASVVAALAASELPIRLNARADMGSPPGLSTHLSWRTGDEALTGRTWMQAQQRAVDHAIVVSIDGLRPDAIKRWAGMLDQMGQEGVRAVFAETLARSLTLPSHASMLTGVGTKRHGMRFNSHRPGRGQVQFPTILRVARAARLHAAAFVGKRKLNHLVHRDGTRFTVGGPFCTQVNRYLLPYLSRPRRGVTFVHYADPDGAGHRDGWMTSGYERAVKRVDRCLSQVIEAVSAPGRERTLFLVTSDHGGHDRTHGSARTEDVRIPWIVWARGTLPLEIHRPVHTTDTAPTILRALGLPLPHDVEGQMVPEAVLKRLPRQLVSTLRPL